MELTDKKPITIFIVTIRKHVEILHKLQQEVLKPHYLDKYPIRDLLNFYEKQLSLKLQSRQKNSQVFSDILMWYAPKFIMLLYKIECYLTNLPKQLANSIIQTPQNLELPQNTKLQKSLQIPKKFIEIKIIECIKQLTKQTLKKNINKKQLAQLIQFNNLLQKLIQIVKNYKKQFIYQKQLQSKIYLQIYPNILNVKQKNYIKKYVFKILFLAKLKIKSKQVNKKITLRKFRIQQLIQGQKKYINSINDYIQYIKNPICQLNILTDLQKKKLFSTIQSILAFHRIFQGELSKRFLQYRKYQTYGDLINANIPFFKIYTDYIQYADGAQAMLLKLQQTNENVKAICTKFMLQKQKIASDQLKQPTFRIAKYGMIVNQILKNTNILHPDYPLLKQAQKQININLSKINQTVDMIARRTRLYQLDQQFATEQRPIITSLRCFIQQFCVMLITDQKMQQIFLEIFNDLIMIIDQNRKILFWIDIDSNFYVRREEDNKTYRNIVKINSKENGILTVSAGNQDRHSNKAESMYKILKEQSKINKDIDRIMYVHVIGTEDINTSNFNKFTQYIAQIKYMDVRKFCRFRFSLMRSFVSKMQEYYKNDLGISLDEGLKDSWFYNYNSKTIQDRKRSIQQILQKMLNNNIIRNNSNFILKQLGIQPNFITICEMNKLKNAKNSQMLQSVLRQSQSQIKQAQIILSTAQLKMGRDSYHDSEYVQRLVQQSDKLTILIHTMVGEQPIQVQIAQYFTVQDVCYEVSSILGLKTNRDFRLFHQVGKKQLRVLDPDQKIIKLFQYYKKEQKHRKYVINIIKNAINFICPQSPPKLIFKKYYYLPPDIEIKQYKNDITRLRLILYQLLDQVKHMKYNLSFQDYLLFLAILIYVQYDGIVPDQTQQNYVGKIIPDKIFKIKNQTQQYWLNQCKPHLLWLSQEIDKIITHNRKKVQVKLIRQNSQIHFQHRHICSLLAINKIRSNMIFGSNLFYVQLTRQTYQKLQKQGKIPMYNMWLVIKPDSILLMSPSSKEIILQINNENIDKFVVQTKGIIFKVQDISTCTYSFNTCQPFEISQLIKYYKCLAQTIAQLNSTHQTLITKTRDILGIQKNQKCQRSTMEQEQS